MAPKCPKHFIKIEYLESLVLLQFGIIGLVETWLKDKPLNYFNLSGYNLEFQNRSKKRGGGVCLYIKDDIKYMSRNDLQQIKHPDNVESIFIEIERPCLKNIVIGNMYRPPDQDMNVFNDFIDYVLRCATKNQKLVYLMGNFNINLLNEDVHPLTNDFVNVITSHSLYPSITKPTRITSRTATLIDNIFTNSKSKQTSGIIITDLSDHLPIFISTDLNVSRNTVKSGVDIRQYTTESVNKLKNELKNVDWENVCNSSDVNESYTNFVNTFNKIHDECIPLKKKRFRSQKNNSRSPWISFALLKCIRRKNVLYKKFLKKPTDVNIEKYKKCRNKLNSTLRLAKRNYFADLLEKEKNNMRST